MKPQIPWLRVFVEGVVIVGSILLAFGIDAWWEGRQEREEEQRVLGGLEVEFTGNVEHLADLIEVHGRFMGQMERFEAMSNAEILAFPPDSVGEYVQAMRRWGTFEPIPGASASLSDGNLLRDADLRTMVVTWQARADDAEEEGAVLIRLAERMLPRMGELGLRRWVAPTGADLVRFRDDEVLSGLMVARLTFESVYLNELQGLVSHAEQVVDLVRANLRPGS